MTYFLRWSHQRAAGSRILFALSIAMLLGGAVEVRAQAPFTGKPRYAIEARRAGAVLGTITVELFPAIAPRAVNYWDSLVAVRFFDSTAFHRVIPGFVIQGGDPNSRHGPRSTWGYGQPDQPNVPAEFSAVSHERGILSAARADDINSANSQFFICVAPARSLNGLYTVYGRVRSGMEIVDQIVRAPRDASDNPLQKIEMFVTRIRSNDTLAVAPVRLAPIDRAGGQQEQPVLRWRPRPDAMLYGVQVSTDSSFASGLLRDVTLSQRDSSIVLPVLPAATTYYWRVRANNGGSVSAWAAPWRFRTGVAAPALLAPANNASSGIPTTPLLEWVAVPGATSYQVQASRGSRFLANQIVLDQANLPVPRWQVGAATNLTVGQRTYWRARAVLGTDPSFWAAPWSFLPSFVTAVAAERAAALGFAPVVPNPVGEAGATLTFTLAAPGPATLTVLDVLGRAVARPVAAPWLPAGEHRATLATKTLSPGTYLLQLNANGQQCRQRVVVE
ncbi:MAG: peptidylprolyl isomerase [Hymenobacteraceae bacterium]|nr:peptidylprolyl isomerase [Hymenobacteraceae bacterium]